MAHVLLIEPDSVLAAIYREVLGQSGHQVTVVNGAQPAISAADHETPDVVILELQLASHNGLEFLYEFRSYPDWQNVPVLVQSVVPPQEFGQSKLLWQELNITSYLYKPRTTLQHLLRSVEGCLAPAALA